MQLRRHQVYVLVARTLKGHVSLQFVVLTTMFLFWTAALLILFMLMLRLYYLARRRYINSRRPIYEPAIELALTEEPQEKISAALKVRRWGDTEVVSEVLLEAMRHLTGHPFKLLQTAASELGLIEFNLRLIHSRSKLRRGKAMEALGIMRAQPGIKALASLLPELTMDMKLVALRALALIGEPSALPCFMSTSHSIPQAMLPRLASLMLEFGNPALPYIQDLIKEHPKAFSPASLRILQAETALAEQLQ